MIFNKTKLSDVKWTILHAEKFPQGIFNNIEKYDKQILQTKCPAVTSIYNRLYTVNSFLDVDLEFGLKKEEPYLNYKFTDQHHSTKALHNLINQSLNLKHEDNSRLELQIQSPYAFVTDDKDIEVVSTPPNLEHENCVYIPGGFKPHSWIRPLHSSFAIKNINKQATIKLRFDKPFLTFFFNTSVNLGYVEATEEMKSYSNSIFTLLNYRKKIESFCMNVISRRPAKFLEHRK
mgnify:CR=1 FL=1